MSYPENIPYPGGGYVTQWYTHGHTVPGMYTIPRIYRMIPIPDPLAGLLKLSTNADDNREAPYAGNADENQ